jgi:hypothetical protein
MAGDYYRYLAEIMQGKNYGAKSTEFYKQAMALAEQTMEPTDACRLGLALNYSVCLYDINKDTPAACELAHKAFEDAIKKLDRLTEQEYKDGTLILQLLRDNLTLWTSEQALEQ